MKARFHFGQARNFEENGYVTFTREENDPKFYGVKGESALFYFLKKWLNERGFNFIKKLAYKDGNLVSNDQYYLRSAGDLRHAHIAIISGFHALRLANEDWNKGEVTLTVYADEGTFTFVQHLCGKELSCARN